MNKNNNRSTIEPGLEPDKIVRSSALNSQGREKILIVGLNFKALVMLRLSLMQAMQKEGYDVYACAGEYHEKSAELLEKNGICWKYLDLKRNSLSPGADAQYFFMLVRHIREIQPDSLFTYGIKPVIYGSLAGWVCRITRRYAMITGLGYAFMGGKQWKQKCVYYLARFLYKISLCLNKTVFFQNTGDLKLFNDLKLVPKRVASIVIPGSGVDIQAFPFVPCPEAPICFLLIGRLLKDKGVIEYIEACQLIKKKYPEAQFDLIAPPDTNPSAIDKSWVERQAQENILHYIEEWVDDVRPFLAKSSVFVLPSYREGTSRATLEAMATGRAIITTHAPGCRETVQLKSKDSKDDALRVVEGENGFLVPVKRSDCLAQAMEVFIKYPEKVKIMGERSRRIAEEQYDVHKINTIILKQLSYR